MMNTAKPWHGYNTATFVGAFLGLTVSGRFLRQREVRPVVLIVADVVIHQAFQMAFVQNNHMVKQIASTVANPTFCNAVLPRTSEACSLRFDAEALHRVKHFLIEVRPAIKYQVAGRQVEGKCLA